MNYTAVVDEIEEGAAGDRLARLVLEPADGDGPGSAGAGGDDGPRADDAAGVASHGVADCSRDGRDNGEDGERVDDGATRRTLVVPVKALPDGARRPDAVLDVAVRGDELVSARVRQGAGERRLARNRRRLRRLARRLSATDEDPDDRRADDADDAR